MAGFTATITLDNASDAVAFVNMLNDIKKINSARLGKEEGAKINKIVDNIGTQLINSADAESIKNYQAAQFVTPPATTTTSTTTTNQTIGAKL